MSNSTPTVSFRGIFLCFGLEISNFPNVMRWERGHGGHFLQHLIGANKWGMKSRVQRCSIDKIIPIFQSLEVYFWRESWTSVITSKCFNCADLFPRPIAHSFVCKQHFIQWWTSYEYVNSPHVPRCTGVWHETVVMEHMPVRFFFPKKSHQKINNRAVLLIKRDFP